MGTEFENIVVHLQYGGDACFNPLFRQAEQQLRKDKESFDVTDIGALAWSKLPIAEYPAAFRTLFYCYWLVDHQEQEEMRLNEQALDGNRWITTPLSEVRDALSCEADDENRVLVEIGVLGALADEVVILRKRLELMRGALEGDAS
jgi:hypothetical protein